MPNSYTFANGLAAWATWIAAAFALQWYGYLSNWGVDGWLLPGIEAAAGLFALRIGPDAAHGSLAWWGWTLLWIPLAGTIWTAALYFTAPFFGGSAEKYRTIISSFAAGYAPLAAMGLVITGVAWRLDWGFWWDRGLLDIAPPLGAWPWLDWAFLGAAAIAPIVQLRVYSLRFAVRGMKMIYHVTLSLAVTTLATAGSAAIAAYFFDTGFLERHFGG